MICITFDTDHMSQESLSRFLTEHVAKMPGTATFFAHSHFPELHRTNHEICPHPFISDLARWDDDVIHLECILPHRPAGIRPHSCVFSHMIGIGLRERGYKYISQAQNMYSAGLLPFRHPWGIWELPIYYMDNMDFWMSKNWPEQKHTPFNPEIIEKAISGDELFVFDIHPLHVALNTRSHDDYVKVKSRVVDLGESPFANSYAGEGVRTFFTRLCERMNEEKARSFSCLEALRHFGCV